VAVVVAQVPQEATHQAQRLVTAVLVSLTITQDHLLVTVVVAAVRHRLAVLVPVELVAAVTVNPAPQALAGRLTQAAVAAAVVTVLAATVVPVSSLSESEFHKQRKEISNGSRSTH